MTARRRRSTPSITPVSSLPFHARFDLPLDLTEARRRFTNRVNNLIFDAFLEQDIEEKIYNVLRWRVAMDLGEEHSEYYSLKDYASRSFFYCLRVIESCHATLQDESSDKADELDGYVQGILDESEVELGLRWQEGAFIRVGAKLLDDKLINSSLQWLADPKLRNVYEPFAKGLRHFLKSEEQSELLYDVITDMYESVEALAKLVTARPRKDLSANAELFIQHIRASSHYKTFLKDYIVYANDFRHAMEQGRARPKLSFAEVESFVYLTGLFIRLAMNQAQGTESSDLEVGSP